MSEQLIKQIKMDLENVVSTKRYIHTMGVVESSKELAIRYDEDVEKATIAALMHDYAKDFKKERLMEFINQANIELDEVFIKAKELLHGKVAALIAKRKYNIEDEDILNAIEFHTTGRENMSKLEKIIYLADFIEPGRDYKVVEGLRVLAKEDLDRAVLKTLDNTIKYVIDIEKPLHPNTFFARNELLVKLHKV
ncbi:bis(5'-nucleosyl)-tetraphosphatase (symmetrical) YqeK [Serpentinicella alkaliphila]|uniref:bis(5'-nucleosyl)-tetraphosphatase (symmetrical) n=1 Tax=Serpentinicella alkaliphila TaxID=1734049 RepID=A0A4R2TVG5_9FIRM|nr:bis(5'-nucleosyl)-tetraphosphatase (symmetrical) YqeK [Serpentinicella alkaliphila]QUH26758.1 bis(5'-nucleosyl)-tetraphosphatase (symmetrical) YqeK [Serpentinicella alkaliphila]TCQ07978.1 putative HD superfamily hydrolase involved in NAD metabolism [Serpentinicella alkaliphila]